MDFYSESMNYDYFDRRFGKPSLKKCIDGQFTGSNKCCGFCNYSGHPGFLTQRNIADHWCLEKQCQYFVPKVKMTAVKRKDTAGTLLKQAESIVLTETNQFEGFRITGLKWESSVIVINYVSVSMYNLIPIAKIIENKVNTAVRFNMLQCDYAEAISFIFGKGVAKMAFSR